MRTDKSDLHINESGYHKQVVIAADQQTYALMKDLQRQYPDHYSWLTILHGDWHTLQLLAEIIRDILSDGGCLDMNVARRSYAHSGRIYTFFCLHFMKHCYGRQYWPFHQIVNVAILISPHQMLSEKIQADTNQPKRSV